MAYSVYLNNILLPITPGAITIEAEGKNEVIELIDGAEINVLKKPGLKVINFEARLPQTVYPFSVYENGEFKPAQYYIEAFEKLRDDKIPFQFIINRFVPTQSVVSANSIQVADLNGSFDTNLRVGIESMPQNESADYGLDIILDITLRECPDYSTKTFTLQTAVNTGEVVYVEDPPNRPVTAQSTTDSRTYKVQSGDTLWQIAARELGNGSRYREIAQKNNVSDPNRISAGLTLDLTGL